MSRRAGAATVALTALAVYAGTIDDYFVQDDFGVVWLLSQKPATYFPRWFVSTWMDDIWGYTPDEIRPFVAVSYQLASLAGPGSPEVHHAPNIGFHALAGILVFLLAQQVARLGVPAATAAGLIFVLLPNQSETAAWITGRVDSLPACAYLAALLSYARWRRQGGAAAYGWSIVWCFVALFSKQNAITIVPALLLFDLVMAGRRAVPLGTWVRPVAPHTVLTAAYLALRYALFGEVARESQLAGGRLHEAGMSAVQHLIRIVFGSDTPSGLPAWLVPVSIAVLALAAARRDGGRLPSPSAFTYFGLVWPLLGLAPTLVAGYTSPRHAYLASAGWAVIVGIACGSAWRSTAPSRRAAAAAALAALVAVYAIGLRGELTEWHERAAASARAAADLERTAAEAPDGALILVGVPSRSWAFALPFVTRPPFAGQSLMPRVSIVSPSALHCCAADQWDLYTRDRIRAWLLRPDRAPVIALAWSGQAGRLVRLSEQDEPALRGLMALLLDTPDPARLDANIERLLDEFVALHGASS